MTSVNLARSEAQARSQALSVQAYRLEIDIRDAQKPDQSTFRVATTIQLTAHQPTQTFLDLRDATVVAYSVDGAPVAATLHPSEGLPLTLTAGTHQVEVTADFTYSTTGEGLHRFVDPADDNVYLYSQFETADAKRMFAGFDQPDLKATYDVTVTAPAGWEVVSNGESLSTSDNDDGSVIHVFATTKPISTYLVALIAGPYAKWEQEYAWAGSAAEGAAGPVSIPLGLYVRQSLAPHLDSERLFAETVQSFDFYHANFGYAYPFGKYDQLFVPEFNMGAMENAGAVTFRDEYIFRSKVTGYLYERRAETILHEMAHMWFGDLVTMRWWDDLWLNESFATFASVLCQVGATEYKHAWTTFAAIEKAWAYRQDQLPSTHPIAADMVDIAAVETNFDGITYAKGASVLKQLVAYVGLEPFLAGLRAYFQEHAFGNASFADLLRALEQASGRDLSGWGDQWLRTTGLNTLEADYTLSADGTFASFAVVQGGAQPGAGELRTHRVAIGVYGSGNRPGDQVGDSALVRTHRVEVDVEGARTEIPELIGVNAGELVLVNDDDLTYCQIKLDERSLTTILERISDFTESLPRTLAWSATWEMTRSGQMRARDFVSLVCTGLAAETEVGVVQRLILQARTALERYAEPGWAEETRWNRFADRLLELARAAEPGSDHQLAFVTGLASSVLSAVHLDVFGALLYRQAEDAGLPGLSIDSDMRWNAITALCASGAAGEAEITAELASDKTAAGQRRAATARASIPSAEAKEAAFTAIFTSGPGALSNALLRATIAGFAPSGQHQLLTQFSDRYFDQIRGFWGENGGEMAQSVVEGVFPLWSAEEDVQTRARAIAEDATAPSGLRRLVAEGLAEWERARTARSVDES